MLKVGFESRAGFSLIEVAVAILILGVITVALMGLFVTGNVFTAQARHEVAALNQAQEILEEIKSIPGSQLGTARGGTERTITLEESASREDDCYNDYLIATTGGPGAGQVRKVVDYDGESRVVTVEPRWDAIPQAEETTYVIFRGNDYNYDFRISVEDKNDENPNLKTVTVAVYYEDRGRQKEVSLTTEKLRR
ncbi:MAG TPA: hypothetical protein DCE07_08890 [Peptococcaceae bacterium]|nr:hypothetical protein [Peptococcaceae bacterium]